MIEGQIVVQQSRNEADIHTKHLVMQRYDLMLVSEKCDSGFGAIDSCCTTLFSSPGKYEIDFLCMGPLQWNVNDFPPKIGLHTWKYQIVFFSPSALFWCISDTEKEPVLNVILGFFFSSTATKNEY